MDLTDYTDEDLDILRHEVAVEQNNRLALVQAKQNIAQLTHQILDAGGTVEEVTTAVVEGEAAKAQADEEKAAAEAEKVAAEEEAEKDKEEVVEPKP